MRLTGSTLSSFPVTGVLLLVCMLTTVCQNIVYANLLIHITQTGMLTKSELVVSSSLLLSGSQEKLPFRE